jgi:ribosomal protein L32E
MDKKYIFLWTIISIVVIAVIIISCIIMNNQKEEKIALNQFKTKIVNDVNSLQKIGFEDIETLSYTLPSGFSELCFFDMSEFKDVSKVEDANVKAKIEQGSRRNLFLIGEDKFEALYVANLHSSVPPYFFCTQATEGNVELKVTKNGDLVDIVVPVYEKYCERAEYGNLCSSLDIAFYSTYSSDCCKEYGLCC